MHYSPTHDNPEKILFSPEIFGKMEKTFWKAHFFVKEDSMKIAVIGASGTIGSKIAAELENAVTR